VSEVIKGNMIDIEIFFLCMSLHTRSRYEWKV